MRPLLDFFALRAFFLAIVLQDQKGGGTTKTLRRQEPSFTSATIALRPLCLGVLVVQKTTSLPLGSFHAVIPGPCRRALRRSRQRLVCSALRTPPAGRRRDSGCSRCCRSRALRCRCRRTARRGGWSCRARRRSRRAG